MDVPLRQLLSLEEPGRKITFLRLPVLQPHQSCQFFFFSAPQNPVKQNVADLLGDDRVGERRAHTVPVAADQGSIRVHQM